MSNPRYGSGRKQFVGHGIEADLGKLDPAAYPGAVAYSNGELYYSDGSEWVVPQDEVDIARPRNLAPTNSTEQSQLRLSAFRSPTGETQTGIIFEINTAGLPEFGQGASLITRTVTSSVASMYQLVYPDDTFEPGETIWWRARYLGTNGTQSQFSIPTAQTFPDLITTPSPVTPSNSITGTVTLTAYDSPSIFGLQYYQTQVEFYAVGAVPGVDTPITTVTQTGGATTTTPIPPLVAGQTYQWRGRYTGRVNVGSPTITSGWSTSRSIFLGAASIVLEYDMDLVTARTIYIPLGPSAPVGEAYSVTIDWGDGTSNVYTSGGAKTKTYAVGFTPTDGRFTVTITGRMTSYGIINALPNQSGLVRVNNFGFNMGLTALTWMFQNATSNVEYVSPYLPETVTNLQGMFFGGNVNAASISDLDTRNVTSMYQMFEGNPTFNRPISNWNTSKVTNMSRMFFTASSFNQNIGALDVSKVTDMSLMFYIAPAFNNGGSSSIGNWNTGAVTSMSNMFSSASAFNQPIGNWNVSNVTNMSNMFVSTIFNQNIGAWDVSKVTNMASMFQSATAFNNGGSSSIGNWNTGAVTNMASMFLSNGVFNQNIGAWDVSKVTNMQQMFHVAIAFNNGGSPAINNWNTGAVTNMSLMFSNSGNPGVHQFNQPIGNWNTSNVTNMSNMFNNTPLFNQNIGAWDVSKVTNMTSMFQSATAFNNGGSSSINNWNTGAVISMNAMFRYATAFNQPIGNWNVSNVTDMINMFGNTGNPTLHAFNQPIGSWNVSKVTAFTGIFWSNHSLNQDLGGWDLRSAGTTMGAFIQAGNFSQENYSRTLIGWANYIATTDGPYAVPLELVSGSQLYNANNYVTGQRFNNATAARAFLVGGRIVSVTGASDANANTTYTYNATTQTYDAANGWKFAILVSSWGSTITQQCCRPRVRAVISAPDRILLPRGQGFCLPQRSCALAHLGRSQEMQQHDL